MSKTILANVDGFTPAIDSIADELGIISAIVFGRMWRFCQMKDGVCNASLETIAGKTGLSRASIMRHAKKLCAAGYLKDQTPDLRNAPHTYADTGKAGIQINLCVSHGNVTLHSETQTVSESHLKKALKKEEEEIAAPPLDLVDAELKYKLHPKAIRDAIAKFFKLTPNWEAKYNRQFMEWALDGGGLTSENIEEAADIWRSDKRFNWQVPTLRGIQEHWFELVPQYIETDDSKLDSSNPYYSLILSMQRKEANHET